MIRAIQILLAVTSTIVGLQSGALLAKAPAKLPPVPAQRVLILTPIDVVRSSDQINPNTNVSNAPSSLFFNRFSTPVQPSPLLQHSDLWVHGVNFGLEVPF
jgi:hypothetical protein